MLQDIFRYLLNAGLILCVMFTGFKSWSCFKRDISSIYDILKSL